MCDLIVYVLSVQLCYSNCYCTKSVLLIMLNKIQFKEVSVHIKLYLGVSTKIPTARSADKLCLSRCLVSPWNAFLAFFDYLCRRGPVNRSGRLRTGNVVNRSMRPHISSNLYPFHVAEHVLECVSDPITGLQPAYMIAIILIDAGMEHKITSLYALCLYRHI